MQVFYSKSEFLRIEVAIKKLKQIFETFLESTALYDEFTIVDSSFKAFLLGPPVQVTVDILINSIGPVSDNDQTFGLDCYLRQGWYDMRLKYNKLPGT